MLRFVPCFGFGAVLSISLVAQAQVIPDNTLAPHTTIVSPSLEITGGVTSGTNLFHSFQQFSIPTGSTAFFNHSPTIQNIFSRVTGGGVSNIDGIIRANGTANLFLLNPNGILFGTTAALNIGGSFIGTTASSLRFADGTEFRASNPTVAPLLTMSVPVGLQMGQNPGAIQLQGNGHSLTAQHPLFAPYVQTSPHGGLTVQSGQTLALVGGSIALNGGVLTTSGGQIELGSVQQGTISLTPTSTGFNINYANATQFGDVQLQQRSLITGNGSNSGAIQIQGRNISLRDGSVLWVQNRGEQPGGAIRVHATDTLSIQGARPNRLVSSIRNETVAAGAGGNIRISAAQTQLIDGGNITTHTFSPALGGTIDLNTNHLIVQGYIPQSPDIYSGIAVLTFGQGTGGNLSVTTQAMTVQAGGYVGSGTLGPGQGGTVRVQADAVTVDGATPALFPSTIGAATAGLGGNSGDLTLNTRTLSLTNSGFVTTSGLGQGSAGNLVVNASESIDIRGRYAPGVFQSVISSNITFPTPAYAAAFGLTGTPNGSAGNVTVNTAQLRLSDEGSITTANDGLGNAGTVRITADSIRLDRGADITAFTEAGEGGSIEIQAQSLILQQESQISARVRSGSGNGGNITIQAPIIVGFGNSDIVASAVNGRGGNIQISTQGIFGLKDRPQRTSDNDITASSQFGVNGTVQINTIDVDPNAGLVDLPNDLTDPSQKMAQDCLSNQGSSFIISGRGGVPMNPMDVTRSDRTWKDLRDLSAFRNSLTSDAPTPQPSLVEATSWRRNPATGKVELIAAQPAQFTDNATCH